MAADYTVDAKGALADLKAAGVGLVLTRKTPNVFDPITGELTSTEISQTLFGILKSPKTFRGNTGFDQTLDDACRLGRAKVFFCAAYGASFQPEVADVLAVGAINFKVHAITVLAPSGSPITFSLTLIQE